MRLRGMLCAVVLATCCGLSASNTLGQSPETAQQPPEPKPTQDCPDAKDLPHFKRLDQIELRLRAQAEEIPADCSKNVFSGTVIASARTNVIRDLHWQPTNFFHQPLYFDDQPLERYGQSICPPLQPAISGARFFLTFPILPYKMGSDPYCSCLTSLGYYRPGNCNPCMREKLAPCNREAVLLQVGTTLGMVFLLP